MHVINTFGMLAAVLALGGLFIVTGINRLIKENENPLKELAIGLFFVAIGMVLAGAFLMYHAFGEKLYASTGAGIAVVLTYFKLGSGIYQHFLLKPEPETEICSF